jgi:hypothetical protein
VRVEHHGPRLARDVFTTNNYSRARGGVLHRPLPRPTSSVRPLSLDLRAAVTRWSRTRCTRRTTRRSDEAAALGARGCGGWRGADRRPPTAGRWSDAAVEDPPRRRDAPPATSAVPRAGCPHFKPAARHGVRHRTQPRRWVAVWYLWMLRNRGTVAGLGSPHSLSPIPALARSVNECYPGVAPRRRCTGSQCSRRTGSPPADFDRLTRPVA